MEIYRLPVLADNYIFVLHDPQTRVAAVVDPAVAPPVLDCLQRLGAELVAIFNTHHHSDHIGGNTQLLRAFPGAVVYGGAVDQGRIPGQQVFLQGGDRVQFAQREAMVFFVPGHTRAHIAYYFPPQEGDTGHLFCGDTLFGAGCGRLFEGTPAQMMESLGQLRQLPDETQVWCAHEYTLTNLRFALSVDPENIALQHRYQKAQGLRQQSQATIPSTIGLEKQTNPFLRSDQPALQHSAQTQDTLSTFTYLRNLRNDWR